MEDWIVAIMGSYPVLFIISTICRYQDPGNKFALLRNTFVFLLSQ